MSIMTLEQFAQLYDTSVSKVFTRSFNSVTDIAGRIFKRPPTKISDDVIKSRQYANPGSWEQRPDGVPTKVDELFQGYGVSITPLEYKKEIVATQRMVEVDDSRKILADAGKIGLGAARTIQEICADVLNNAFTSAVGGDSKPLCASDHPYADPAKAGITATTQSNTSASNLAIATPSTLAAARLALLAQKDERGKTFLDESATILLVVPPDLTDVALTLTKTTNVVNSANNDINVNAISGRYEVVTWNQLTSAKQWFLIHPDSYLMDYIRVAPDISAPEIDRHVWTVTWFGRMSRGVGFEDWRGVWGSTGT